MRLFSNLLILLAAITAFSTDAYSQSTPSANDIFQKYSDAIGVSAGKKITSRMIKGTLEIKPIGLKGAFEMYSKTPNKNLTVLNLPGIGDFLDGFDGTEAWGNNPVQGFRIKDGDELEQTKDSSDFYYDLNLNTIYPKASVTGSDKVGDADAWVVKADDLTTLYFDKQTGFLARADREVTSPEGKVKTQVFYSDYREVDGFKQAFQIRQVTPMADITFTSAEIKQNVEIDNAKFAKPKQN